MLITHRFFVCCKPKRVPYFETHDRSVQYPHFFRDNTSGHRNIILGTNTGHMRFCCPEQSFGQCSRPHNKRHLQLLPSIKQARSQGITHDPRSSCYYLAWLSFFQYHSGLFFQYASATVLISSYATPEIRLSNGAIRTEGIGAVLSGIKSVLLLANATGAVVTANKIQSGHGYPLSKFIRFLKPRSWFRVVCKPTVDVNELCERIVSECANFSFDMLSQFGIFENCNTLVVQRYLSHPRKCLVHSAALVRSATVFHIPTTVKRTATCILRRGGDVEQIIEQGKGNMWAIDEQYTLPIIRTLKHTHNATIVVITETTRKDELQKKYHANTLSNRESLWHVVNHLTQCRCTFISAGSSFASAMMQIAPPDYIIHTVDAPDFSFAGVAPYAYEEYGDRAVSVRENASKIVTLCIPPEGT